MSEQFMKNKNYYYNVGTIHEKQKLLLYCQNNSNIQSKL